jgi:hypothetical protein
MRPSKRLTDLTVIPANAGIHLAFLHRERRRSGWIPAFAGMTSRGFGCLFALVAGALSAIAAAQSLPSSLQAGADALPRDLRAHVLERQARLDAMTPAEREELDRRVAAWDALAPEERRARREAWMAWQALPPAERETLRVAVAAFAALPPDQRQALRARFDALDESERQGWLLGPAIGADWPRLHALFAQVPEAQTAALRAALRALTPEARADLAVLAQRTPPQARDELRNALLATPMHARGAWLRRQVDP